MNTDAKGKKFKKRIRKDTESDQAKIPAMDTNLKNKRSKKRKREDADANQAKFTLSNKRQRRLKAKKQKIEAFLELTKHRSLDEVELPFLHTRHEKRMAYKFGEVCSSEVTVKRTKAQEKIPTEEELKEIRQRTHKRKQAMMEKPKVYLTLADLQVPNHVLQQFGEENVAKYMPLFVLDIQHLLLYAIQGNISSYKPRWCKVLRPSKVSQVVVIMCDDVGSVEYTNYVECFPYLKANFEIEVEMISPSVYGSTVLKDLCTVPFSFNKLKKEQSMATSERKKDDIKKNVLLLEMDAKEMFNGAAKNASQRETCVEPELISAEEFNRTHLLLSPQQMIQEQYPTPIGNFNDNLCRNYVFSKDKYEKVTADSPIFAIDCEMCLTTKKNELTWVAVVNEDLETVYSTLVKPFNPIKNYITQYSGVTKKMMEPVTTTLRDVQEAIKKILPSDAIICGQSLNGDLHALEMYHPYVIDTSVIYNLAGYRGIKPGLRKLSSFFLSKEIQNHGNKGHNPIEDAVSTMELVKLKLEKGPTFGDLTLGAFNSNSFKGASNKLVKRKKMDIQPNMCEKCGKPKVKSKEYSQDATNFKNPVKKCLSCEKLKPGRETISDENEKRKIFFERPGSNVNQSIFELLAEENKSVTVQLIGGFQEHKDAPKVEDNTNVVVHETQSDKSTVKKCKKCINDNFLTMAMFRDNYSELKTENEKKKALLLLDKKIKTSLKYTKDSSVVIVIFGGSNNGRNTDKPNKLMCLTKVIYKDC